MGRENLRLYERSWNQLGEGLNIDTPGIISFTRVAFQGVVLELTDFLGKFMRYQSKDVIDFYCQLLILSFSLIFKFIKDQIIMNLNY